MSSNIRFLIWCLMAIGKLAEEPVARIVQRVKFLRLAHAPPCRLAGRIQNIRHRGRWHDDRHGPRSRDRQGRRKSSRCRNEPGSLSGLPNRCVCIAYSWAYASEISSFLTGLYSRSSGHPNCKRLTQGTPARKAGSPGFSVCAEHGLDIKHHAAFFCIPYDTIRNAVRPRLPLFRHRCRQDAG
jgi:hypothetical protein